MDCALHIRGQLVADGLEQLLLVAQARHRPRSTHALDALEVLGREGDKERKRERKKERKRECVRVHVRVSVCVCVCVCQKEEKANKDK